MEKKEKSIFQRLGFPAAELSPEEKAKIAASQSQQVSKPGQKEEGVKQMGLLDTPLTDVKNNALGKLRESGAPPLAVEALDVVSPDDLDVTSKVGKLAKFGKALGAGALTKSLGKLKDSPAPSRSLTDDLHAGVFGKERFDSDTSKKLARPDATPSGTLNRETGAFTPAEVDATELARKRENVARKKAEMEDRIRNTKRKLNIPLD